MSRRPLLMSRLAAKKLQQKRVAEERAEYERLLAKRKAVCVLVSRSIL